MADVRCDHLVREYTAGVRALDDVSLTVQDGEILVLVGPSGCGKSTLLRIIAGLETADSGTVSIAGRDVSAMTPPERNVAMVFQDYALYPHMTVRRNLEFPLRVRGDEVSAREERVSRIATMLGLTSLLDRLPRELSGGQRQRVAMGRALVREPAVSLLDEPLSNLDAQLRSEVRAEIADLQRRTRTTMIYVTHDQVEAMTLGHRVAVLERGVLRQVAPPAELYARPANAFVAGFIGNPPMNLLPLAAVEGGQARIQGVETTLDIAKAVTQGASPSLGQATVLGVRPESLQMAEAGSAGSIPATVDHVELLGHETLVHASLGPLTAGGPDGEAGETPRAGLRVTARIVGTHRLEHGAPVALVPAPDRIHLFDAHGDTL